MRGWSSKVVWSEGMFLRTQHFQQQDRYIERLVRDAVAGLASFGWGLRGLGLDRTALGTVAVAEAEGVFPDGTPFRIPDQHEPPPAFEVRRELGPGVVYLATPVWQEGAPEIDADGQDDTGARYRGHRVEVPDTVAGMRTRAPIEVGRMRLRLLHEAEDRAGYACLGIARIRDIGAQGEAQLDETYIPPCLHAGASRVLTDLLNDLESKLAHNADWLKDIVVRPREAGVATTADFLLLQLLNRTHPIVAHHAALRLIHPEALYALLVGLAGEFATFTSPEKRPPAFPTYRHDDLAGCFGPVIAELRRSLGWLPERPAVPIELYTHQPSGVRTAVVADRNLLERGRFVLAVRAAVPSEVLRARFPEQAKVGPTRRLEELVTHRRPGIPLEAAHAAPREIPFYEDAMYFVLRPDPPRGELYREFQSNGHLAVHVAGGFPELSIACWAIRGAQA